MNANQILETEIGILIRSEPLLRDCVIEIVVNSDHIRLHGWVNQFCKKYLTRKIVKRRAPDRTIIEEIKVLHDEPYVNSDAGIVTEIITRLRVNLGFSSDKIITTVKNGYVTLNGQLPWSYQKELVEESICDIPGLVDIANNITISPFSEEIVLKNKIAAVLRLVTSQRIEILISGSCIYLKGIVNSDHEKKTIIESVQKVIGTAVILTNELLVADRAGG